jgi:PAS domain S-box-containing protein
MPMAVQSLGVESLDREALGVLYRASRRIAQSRSAAQIIRALLHGIREATGCVSAGLYELGHAAEPELRLIVGPDGAAGLPNRLATGIAKFQQACRSGSGALTFTQLHATADTPQRTLVLASVCGADALHGVVAALWPDAAPHDDAPTSALLLALGEDAGHALDQSLSSAAAPSDALLAALRAITEIGLLYSGLLDHLLQNILTQILSLKGMGGGAIFLVSELDDQIELAACARGPNTDYGDDPARLWTSQLLDQSLSLARETAGQRYPSLTLYASAGEPETMSLGTALQRMHAANLVSLPLIAGNWVIGVLQVVAAPGAMIEEEQIQQLRLIACQTAAAIENARRLAQIRADQERMRAVVDTTNDAILVLDEYRRPLMVNRRARFFFGLTERDLLGKNFDQLGADFGQIFEDGQRFNHWLAQLLDSRSNRAVEEFSIRKPEARLLQCFSAPVIDLNDRYLGRLLVFRDITREREVERMKNEFVSTVSHELRTPLTSIQGALQLVLGRPGSTGVSPIDTHHQRVRDLLGISLTNTERLIRLINDILDVAKIEQGHIQLRREALAPDELCRSSAAAVGALASAHGIMVELQIAAGLPAVLADRDRSIQILLNLLSNAIKFSFAGQRVVLSAHDDGQMIVFAVQDWGRGIATEHQTALFQKFQQIDGSTTRDVGGTGLGLAISKALVEEQGGRMWLESTVGVGSTFSFSLPCAPVDILESRGR